MKVLPTPTSASVYCLQRRLDAEALMKTADLKPKIWDFGFAKVHFDSKHCARIVNRQGLTLAEQPNASYSQITAFLLQQFW